ncbi:hypothetical protein [Winogradskyella sp. PE311]|uniref:hypothetical protein n=1 Tax=Winogradskyella sp. PE311 TaxID=3366943 RepID=UPI00397FD96C
MLKINFNKSNTQLYILLLAYLSVFVYCILSEPIYSHDTYSYLRAMPYRQLGYVIFLKTYSAIFGSFFDTAVVITHTIFSLAAVHFFFYKTSKLFQLNLYLKIPYIVILLLPFFPPLSIANNICSEGLSYGLYLIYITIGLDILFNAKQKSLKRYVIVYLALVFMRSQFIFSTLIFAGTYFLIYRKSIITRGHLIRVMLFCGVMLVASLTERTYHKLKDGFFKPTPLGFTSASTAPIYVSDTTDYNLIENEHYRQILKISYDTLNKKELFPKADYSAKASYKFFHDNLPKICNQTVRVQGFDYYYKRPTPKDWSANQIASYPFFETEEACKEFTKVLIIDNFQKWLKLYYSNINYGFQSPLILYFIVCLFFFSLIKSYKNANKDNISLFLFSSLILSNAMFIAFAVHSIQRYLFYNYGLLFLILIIIINLLKRERAA